MILVIDNYDSFTYNLVQYLGELGTQPLVRRNNEITLDEIAALAPETDRDFAGSRAAGAGRHHARRHQAVRTGDAAAGRLPWPPGHRHGVRRIRRARQRADAWQTSTITTTAEGCLPASPARFTVARYHSLVVERDGLPAGTGNLRADRG